MTVSILIFGGAVRTDKKTGQSSYDSRRVARNITIIDLEAHSPHGWVIKNPTHYIGEAELKALRATPRAGG